MADNHSPLNQLADISEPAIQYSFALAPLYWLLLGLMLVTLLYLAIRAYRRHLYFAAKRDALQLLAQTAAAPHQAAAINALLKRVLQQYQPGHPALSVSTACWQHWLASQQDSPLPDLSKLLYQGQCDAEATAQYYHFARRWLEHYQGEAPWPQQQTEQPHA